ncbi:hypothetical protein L9F63_019037, partial [Diploptera punctata]
NKNRVMNFEIPTEHDLVWKLFGQPQDGTDIDNQGNCLKHVQEQININIERFIGLPTEIRRRSGSSDQHNINQQKVDYMKIHFWYEIMSDY